MGKIRISYPFMLLSAALLAFDREGLMLLLWASIIVHEAGHLAAIRLSGCKTELLHIGLQGLRIDYSHSRQTSYLNDVIIAAAGPAANALLTIVLAATVKIIPSQMLYIWLGANTIIGAFNLLPAMPLDGGRIIYALVCRRLGETSGRTAVRALTGLMGVALCAGGLWVWMVTKTGFMPMMMGIFFLTEAASERYA